LIAQRDFDLTNEQEAIAFFREMYNLANELEDLASSFNEGKKELLGKIMTAARPVISLASLAGKYKSTGSALASIPEDPGNGGAQDDLGVFAADDIQLVLRKMNYKISFVPVGVRAPGVFYYCNAENAYHSIRFSLWC